MYVRLAVAWTDPTGTVHKPGDVVDVDVVTLAEMEEQGVLEDLDCVGLGIGPGPGAPPEDDSEPQPIGPGPGSPPKDDKYLV